MNNTALPVKTLSFSFALPKGWHHEPLSVACRLRGALGLSLAKQCCFYDAHHTQCEGCDKRAHCLYGQIFKTPQNMQLENQLKVGCLPHTWSLEVNQQGIMWQAQLHLVGIAIAHAASWQHTIESLPFSVNWQGETWWEQTFAQQWRSVTPARLKFAGRNPKGETELAEALVKSVVSKSKMLASMHHVQLPEAFLNVPRCTQASWHVESGFKCGQRSAKDVSGWIFSASWHQDTPPEWLPWLNLIFVLGVGKQTTFALGRFCKKVN